MHQMSKLSIYYSEREHEFTFAKNDTKIVKIGKNKTELLQRFHGPHYVCAWYTANNTKMTVLVVAYFARLKHTTLHRLQVGLDVTLCPVCPLCNAHSVPTVPSADRDHLL